MKMDVGGDQKRLETTQEDISYLLQEDLKKNRQEDQIGIVSLVCHSLTSFGKCAEGMVNYFKRNKLF